MNGGIFEIYMCTWIILYSFALFAGRHDMTDLTSIVEIVSVSSIHVLLNIHCIIMLPTLLESVAMGQSIYCFNTIY